MKDQESNANWQLEEGNQVDDRWVLRESEQQLAGQWELNQAAEDEPIRDWQPVEYNRPERSGFAWILPVLITVFLLAIIGYSGFILLPQIINPPGPTDQVAVDGETTDPAPAEGVVDEPDPPIAAADEEDEEPPDAPAVVEPVETEDEGDETSATPDETAAPVVEPTPTQPTSVDQDFATVITTYGVNARAEPSADAEIVRVLNQGESFFLFGSPAEGWLEILVTDEDTELVQGEPIQGQVAYAASEFFDILPQPILYGFYEEIMTFAGRPPEAPVATAPGAPDAETDDEAADDTEDIIGDDTDAPVGAPEEVLVTVESEAGLNVRSQPNTIGDIVGLLNQGDTLPALAVSEDEEWIQVQLEEGVTGWVFAEFLTVSGDLSLIGASPPSPAAAPGIIDATQVMTSGIVPPTPFTAMIPGDTPAVVVAVAEGALARLQPSAAADGLTLLPQGAALPALARTADGQWIEVELPQGDLNGWVSRLVVSVTPDIDTLPIEGETDDETTASDEPVLLPTPTPQPSGADTDGDPDTETDATPGAEGITAQVRDILLSVYPEPNSEGNAIALLPRGTVVDVSGRNDDSDWVLIETEDGDSGWVPARLVILSQPAETLPLVEP